MNYRHNAAPPFNYPSHAKFGKVTFSQIDFAASRPLVNAFEISWCARTWQEGRQRKDSLFAHAGSMEIRQKEFIKPA